MSKRLIDVVIAKYNENIEWANSINHTVFIYDKSGSPIKNSIPLENLGREGNTFLYHIVNNYDNLAEITIFLQGNPLDHCRHLNNESSIEKCVEYINNLKFPIEFQGFLQDIYCYDLQTLEGRPINWTVNADLNTKKGIFKQPLSVDFPHTQGAQYIVPKEYILHRPIEFYKKLLKMSMTNEYCDDKKDKICAWGLERLWVAIFKKEYEINPRFLEF
jgi:hypothetical protein